METTGASQDGAERRRQFKRRGLIAGTAVLSAALMAKLSVKEAAATDGVALVTGANNTSAGETRITRTGATQLNAFTVAMAATVGAAAISGQGAGSTVGAVGTSENQVGVIGISGTNLGVLGTSTDSYGIKGQSTNSVGVYGIANTLPGVYGTGNGIGVEGVSGGNFGVLGVSGSNIGVQGNSTSAPGVRGDSVSNIGVVGFSASNVGVQGQSTSGIGVYGISSSGIAGRFDGQVVVNGDFSATGMKSAVVKASDGETKRLYCMESPESWFEDMGEAQLSNGFAAVAMPADFATVVNLNAPYFVFVTANEDCNGLVVAERSSQGFVVKELRGGNSSAKFSYRILAKRADITAARLQKEDFTRQSSPNSVPHINTAPPSIPEVPAPPPLPSIVNQRPH
jgi:hypothetical protein